MSGLVTRYWHSLSPALQRYYRASAWPSLAFIALAVLHQWTAGKTGLATGVRMVVALAPVVMMAWLFVHYLRFLRDCDELERRIELGALAWAAGISMLASMAAILLLDAELVTWSAQHVATWLCLLLVGGYALVRSWLHRRYA